MAADTERFDPRKAQPDAQLLELAGGRPLAGYVGSLGGWHGAEHLLAVAAELKRRNSPVLVVAVGDSPDRIARIASRVRELGLEQFLALHPAVDHQRVPGILAALRVGVIPGTQDWSVPTKLFEYGAMALPIVTAGQEVVREFVETGPDGTPGGEPWALCVEPGNAVTMADAVERALADETLASAMGVRARQTVLARHTWKANVNALVSALDGWRSIAARPAR
jgi:glycosyltransferase involved in cell wall biosynthesis